MVVDPVSNQKASPRIGDHSRTITTANFPDGFQSIGVTKGWRRLLREAIPPTLEAVRFQSIGVTKVWRRLAAAHQSPAVMGSFQSIGVTKDWRLGGQNTVHVSRWMVSNQWASSRIGDIAMLTTTGGTAPMKVSNQ